MKTLLLLITLTLTVWSNAQYAYVPDDQISTYVVKGKLQIINYYTEKVLCKDVPADDIVTGANHGLLGFKKGEKYGLMNFYGKIIVPATLDAYDLGEGTYPLEMRGNYFAVRKGEKTGLIDSTGKFSVPLGNYDYLWDAKAGFGAAEKDGLFGLFKNGKTILPMEYNSEFQYGTPFEFYRESEIITKGEYYGLINNKGIIIQAPVFIDIYDIADNYWVMRNQDSKHVLADYSGKIVLKPTFDKIYDVQGNYIMVQEGNKNGVVRFDGTIACPIEYEYLGYDIMSDAIFVKQNDRWGIFNLKTQKQLSIDYDNQYAPMWLKSGLAAVRINGLWGMVNTEGKVVTQPAFDNVEMPVFYEGYAQVRQNGKSGILSSEGKLILPCLYDELNASPYRDQVVSSNGKMGLLSKKFEVLVPCEYDEINYLVEDKICLVSNEKKVGLYQIGKGLITPTKFDEISSYLGRHDGENFLKTMINNKIGFLDMSGKQLLPNVAETIFNVNNSKALIKENGQLKRYSIQTGEEIPLVADSIRKFETTTFKYVDLMWYCISTSDQKIIGQEYTQLGQFDSQGRAVAYTSSFDNPIAINTMGENIKPGFHLVVSPVLDTIIDSQDLEAIDAILATKNLVDPMSEIPVVEQMRENLITDVSVYPMYDEWGNEMDVLKFNLVVYHKKNYYGPGYPFPSEPIYEYTFSNHYSNWSLPNKEGWRWATLKEYPNEERSLYLSEHTVLVNNIGEEIRKTNYIPVTSVPFFEHTFNADALMVVDAQTGELSWEMNESLPWEKLGKYTKVIDSVQTYFPTVKGLTNEQFIAQYKDSIYISIYSGWAYVPEYEEVQTFTYRFFKSSGTQLFDLPPPNEVKYRFVLANLKQLKGGEKLSEFHPASNGEIDGKASSELAEIPYIQAITIGEKQAFAFGDVNYFVLPPFSDYDSEADKKEIIQSYLKDTAYTMVKPYLEQAEKFQKLIELGVAKHVDYGATDEKLNAFVSAHGSSLQIYFYPKNVALAMENELLLEPKYLSIATDNTAMGKKGNSTFIAIDTLLNVWRYDLSTRKLVLDKEHVLTGIIREGIFTQNIKTKLHSFNNSGVQLGGRFDDNLEEISFIPNLNNIQQLEFIGNCDYSQPIVNIYGEDSIVYHEDGTSEFIYYNFCDTNVLGKYGRFKNGLNLHAYKQLNQPVKLVYNYVPVEQYAFTTTSISSSIPLNDMFNGEYTIEESTEGLRIKSNNRTLDISEKEYLAARDIPALTNGYGGIYRKGKFIPYQTLLPFPEKHAVYIHLNKDNYLVGEKGQLELVKLGNDQSLTKSGLFFTSGEDFNEKFENDFSLRYSIQDFVGY